MSSSTFGLVAKLVGKQRKANKVKRRRTPSGWRAPAQNKATDEQTPVEQPQAQEGATEGQDRHTPLTESLQRAPLPAEKWHWTHGKNPQETQ